MGCLKEAGRIGMFGDLQVWNVCIYRNMERVVHNDAFRNNKIPPMCSYHIVQHPVCSCG